MHQVIVIQTPPLSRTFMSQSKGIDILAINEIKLHSTINDSDAHLTGCRKFKHAVYRRRQTAKVTSDFLFFSCNL